MHIGFRSVGSEGAHKTGRNLLAEMYETYVGGEMPPILIAPRGKPYFAQGTVHFSISHTKKTVFCVLSHRPVGIDAEEMDRPIRKELAEKILSPREKAEFLQASDPTAALLKFWVLKEAAAKATGEGLKGYPNHTEFSLCDPRLRSLQGCYVAVVESELGE